METSEVPKTTFSPEIESILSEEEALGEGAHTNVAWLSRLGQALWVDEHRSIAVEILKLATAAADHASPDDCWNMTLFYAVVNGHFKAATWLTRHLIARGIQVDMIPGFGIPTRDWLQANPDILPCTPETAPLVQHALDFVDGVFQETIRLDRDPNEVVRVLQGLGWLEPEKEESLVP